MKDSGSAGLRLGDRRRGAAGRLPRHGVVPRASHPLQLHRRRGARGRHVARSRPRTPCAARWPRGRAPRSRSRLATRPSSSTRRRPVWRSTTRAPSTGSRGSASTPPTSGTTCPGGPTRSSRPRSTAPSCSPRSGAPRPPSTPRSSRAAVTFPAGKVKVVKPVEGATLSVGEDRRRGRGPVAEHHADHATGRPRLLPRSAPQEVDRAVAEFASPAVSGAGHGQGRGEDLRRRRQRPSRLPWR